MATKGPHDVAHTLNVASTIVSNYLQNAFLKCYTFLSPSQSCELLLEATSAPFFSLTALLESLKDRENGY